MGEALDAKLVARTCAAPTTPQTAALIQRIVAEENEDRHTLVSWIILRNSTLSEADRPEVVGLYRQLLLEESPNGTWHQSADGAWQELDEQTN